MQAIQMLMDEHRIIKQVLACLEKLAGHCAAGEPLDVGAARQMLEFFRNFADGCHHRKEEARLFPMLEARGMPREEGPTSVMRHEHDEGRRYVAAMTGTCEEALRGQPNASRAFAKQAQGFAALMREHIDKEDHCLFPAAERLLTEADRFALQHSFDRVEKTEVGDGLHEKYLALADELADRYGVAHAVTTSTCGHCCGHGHS
jgi:hemerythrin-like domain-containing protein